jgi:hypothetical protein
MSLSSALAQLASAASACAQAAQVGASSAPDALLLDQQRQLAAATRLIEVASSALAAEIAQRSRPELGYDGLAQKMGARTPQRLVQQITGASAPTARRLVRVGALLASGTAHDADPTVPFAEPWLAPVLSAVAAGALSGQALDVIRAGLGAPGETVTVEALATAAITLTGLAPGLRLELLAARARELRDELDCAGVAEREEQRRQRRFLHLYPQHDGMTRLSGLLDPESAAVLKNAIDAATSPRRGGPRFVATDDATRAAALVNDPRSTEQIALDALVELVDIAVRAHGTTLLGVRRADVRLLVTERDLARRAGVGFIEGQHASVSIATVERHACDGGYLPVLFTDNGQSLNVGQTQRFHTTRQRTAIAARDGGCLAPDCERPPSWCEVHHINPYSTGGDTSVSDGVLLCRYHHLLTHNNNWRITRSGDKYSFVPPPGIDPPQKPIALHSKSPAIRRLLATAGSHAGVDSA